MGNIIIVPEVPCVKLPERNCKESSYGTCVVPQPIGPVTRFNLYGKEIVHKEKEKEPREIERGYHIVDKDENPIGQKTKIKEVSWRILPPGKYPWERAEKALDDYFEKDLSKNKEVLRKNHKTFAEYEPDFLAIGENSFNGYVVYGYSDRNLYVFESNQPGNAIYVFKGKWQKASQLTKHDIIKGNLCHKRIVYTKSWKENVERMFK